MIVFEPFGSSFKLPNALLSVDTVTIRACCLSTEGMRRLTLVLDQEVVVNYSHSYEEIKKKNCMESQVFVRGSTNSFSYQGNGKLDILTD